MALPKIDTPTFNLALPINNKKLKYRPFRVKEQKNMMIAAESGNSNDIIQTMVDLVNGCTFNAIDFMDEPLSHLEWVFINTRAKAIGEVVEMTYKCAAVQDSKQCDHSNVINVDIRTAKIEGTTDNVIEITPGIKVVIQYVTPRNIIDNLSDDELLLANTQMVIDGEDVITEFTKEELIEFYDSIPVEAGERINLFLQNQPILKLHIPTKCEKCGTEDEIVVTGALNFFG